MFYLFYLLILQSHSRTSVHFRSFSLIMVLVQMTMRKSKVLFMDYIDLKHYRPIIINDSGDTVSVNTTLVFVDTYRIVLCKYVSVSFRLPVTQRYGKFETDVIYTCTQIVTFICETNKMLNPLHFE